jgi:tRNA-dihydrouridine synthase B
VSEIREVLIEHLHDLHGFYGMERGVKVARKHISWYTKGLAFSAEFRHRMNQLETSEAQLAAVDAFFGQLMEQGRRLAYRDGIENGGTAERHDAGHTQPLAEAA